METEQRKRLQLARRAAVRIIRSRSRTLSLVDTAFRKAFKHRRSLRRVWGDLNVMLRMVRAYGRREYRSVPWRSLLLATTAIVYFVNPFDLISDFLVAVGLVDDIGVATMVAAAIGADLERFLEWENQHPPAALS